MRRPPLVLLVLPAAAVLVAFAALVIPAARGGGEPSAAVQPTAASLELAARRTIATPSGRFAFTVTSTAGGERASFSGAGSYDNVRRRSAMRIDLSSLGDASVDALETRFVDGVAYVKLPDRGSKWTRSDPGKLGPLGASLGGAVTDPSGLLTYLQGVEGTVEIAGREKVRGVDCTRFTATSPRRADVFVDSDGLVRRLRLELLPTTEPDGPLTEVEVELFDFGAGLVIDAPPA